MWIAYYESRHFTFYAYGSSADEAEKSLFKGLKSHEKQYDCDPDWYSPDEIYSFEVSEGCCYRDGLLISEGT